MLRHIVQIVQWRSVAAALATAATVSSFVAPSPTGNSLSSSCRRRSTLASPFLPLFTTTSCDSPSRGMQVDDSYYYELMNHPTRTASENHVIFGHLLQPNLLERYHVYKRTTNPSDSNSTAATIKVNESLEEVVLANVKLGRRLDGHEGVVHGGILALLLDDSMGYAFEALGAKHAVTANLHIDYRLPVPADTLIIIRVYLKEQVGRKLYFEAEISCPNDSSKVYAEASSLFIIPREYYQDEGQEEVAA